MNRSATRLLACAAFALRLVRPAAAADAESRFECLGIGGGGQMYGVGISPHDGRLMHVSCDMGTFYVSEDGGERWTMVDQLQMVGTTATRPAYHPTDANTLYMPYVRGAASQLRISRNRGKRWEVLCDHAPWGNADGRDKYERGVASIDLAPDTDALLFVSAPTGLFRSVDGGRSFGLCEGIGTNSIGAHVSAAVSGAAHTVVAATRTGVFRSRDGGATWSASGEGLPAEGLLAFAAAAPPSGPVSVYVSTWTQVFHSHDSGETFAAAPLTPEKYTGAYRFLATAPADPRTAYVASTGAQHGTWKTADGGASWTPVMHRNYPGIRWGWIGLELGTGFGGRANRITVDPRDPRRLAYVNTAELFLTEDGGTTWRELCSRYRGPDPASPQKGQPWSGVGLEVALPTDLRWDPFVNNRAYLIYGDIGLQITADRGASWRPRMQGIPRSWSNRVWELIPDPALAGVLYAACCGQHGPVHDVETLKHDGGVVLSRDHGETWKPLGKGLPPKGVPCTGLALDPRSPPEARALYCVMQNDGVYKSVDGGQEWRKLPAKLGRGENHNVEQVQVASDGAVYVLVTGRSRNWKFMFGPGGLWRSTDEGETWTELSEAVSWAYPKEFALDPRDPLHLYVATTQAPGGESAGLWETRDGGKRWRQVLSTQQVGKELFPYIHSGPVSFHPGKPGWVYYATKTHGLWFTQDDGATWRRLQGVPRLGVHRVIADPDDPETIYVTSVGLWKGPAGGL